MKQEKNSASTPSRDGQKQETTNNGKKVELKPLRQKGGVYFHAGAILGKKNTFVTNEYIQLLMTAFKMAELKKDIKNLAYVIMPNFFYWMFRLPETQEDPVNVYGDVKKVVAWEIITNLQNEVRDGAFDTLELFKKNERVGRSIPQKILWTFEENAKKFKENKRYRVWAPKTEIKLLDTPEAIRQKLEIIKRCPVSERWQLVEKAEQYPYLYLADELQENTGEKDDLVVNNVFSCLEPAKV